MKSSIKFKLPPSPGTCLNRVASSAVIIDLLLPTVKVAFRSCNRL